MSSRSVWQLLWEWLLLRHRKGQDLIADDLVLRVVRSWRYVDFERLDASMPAFVDLAVRDTREAFEASQEASFDLLADLEEIAALASDSPLPPRRVFESHEDFNTLDIETVDDVRRKAGSDKFDALRARIASGEFDASRDLESHVYVAEPLDAARLGRVLAGAGAGSVKRALPAPEDHALTAGLKAVSGVAVRYAMDGGRGVMRDVRNERPVGYQRVTDFAPCSFCALLASLGPFYKRGNTFKSSNSKRVANSMFNSENPEPENIAKVHDHCRCTIVPVFSGFSFNDPAGKVALDLWNRVVESGLGGKDAMRVYHSAYRKHVAETENPFSGNSVDESVLAESIERFLKSEPEGSYAAEFVRKKLRLLRSVA